MPKPPSPRDSAGLLDPETPPGLLAPPELNRASWDRAGRLLLAKMIGAFAYEEIVTPTVGPTTDNAGPAGNTAGQYGFSLDDGSTLSFWAGRGAYGGWQVDPDSVRLIGRPAEPGEQGPDDRSHPHGEALGDPIRFLALARRTLGIDGATFGHLVRELSATLSADCRLQATALSAAQLADLGYAELEGHQTGHPWLVLNKGRLGFSGDDAARWSPEARIPGRLPWIAVRRDIATYRGVEALATPERLYARELDEPVRVAFADALRARGLDPAAYLYLPVHPWQWTEMILPLFAAAVADNAIVPAPHRR